MDIPAPDRFLDCVLYRAEKDIIISPLVMLLVVPGSLVFLLVFLIFIYLDWGVWFGLSDTGLYLTSLFLFMDVAFIMYVLVKSITLHIRGDITWMDALAEYAENKGKDASELRSILGELSSTRIRWFRLASFVIFLGSVLMMIISFFIFDFNDPYSAVSPFDVRTKVVLILAMAILCGTSFFGLIRVYRIDDIQCRFTEVFTRVMGDSRFSRPMESCIPLDMREALIAMVAIASSITLAIYIALEYVEGVKVPLIDSPWVYLLGFYFTSLFFYVLHILNRHIRIQWDYESELLNWMAVREGAKRVVRIPHKRRWTG